MDTRLVVTIAGFHLLALFLPLSAVVLFKKPGAWHHLLALFLGLLTGYINLLSEEVQFPVLLLLVFGLFLGFSQQKSAWGIALLLAMWVPIGQFISITVTGRSDAIFTEGAASFIAFLPSFMGTYSGVGLRHAASRLMPQREKATS